jgi:hypothetical protein
MGREERRLRRQVSAIARGVPPLRTPLHAVVEGRLRLIRVPLGVLLILGGVLGFLPVLGLWMLPLGLLLLAFDLPLLRPYVNAAVIRARRRMRVWRRRPGPGESGQP